MTPKPKLRFEYGKRVNGQFYWHIKAANGEIIAQGEGYKKRAGVLKVLRLLTEFDGTSVDLDANPEAPAKFSRKKPKHYEGHIVNPWPGS